jgi:hypothetical protein
LINSQEIGVVSTSVSNPLDEPIVQIIQADISDPNDLFRTKMERQEISIDPGEKREIAWIVRPADKLYDRLILVRVYLYQKVAYGPAQTNHCGILVLDFLGLSSSQILALVIAVSLLMMGVGGLLWVDQFPLVRDWSGNLVKRISALAGLTVAAMAANLAGIFILAAIFCLLAFVVLLTLFEKLMHT